jgi:nicotinamide riboside kinase
MARLQIQTEDQYSAKASGILICDTNLLVIKIWMENAYGICPDWIAESVANRTYDLHLLTNIDLPWEPDPLREHPEKRAYFLSRYESELRKLDTSWQLVSGLGDHRFSQAKSIIESTLVF